MATKHTPGPWKQERNNVVADYTATYGVVASVSAMPNKWETDANARLIAAAPELLASLQEALGLLESYSLGEHQVAENIRAAIALAK